MKYGIAVTGLTLLAGQANAFFFFPLFIPLPLIVIRTGNNNNNNNNAGTASPPPCPPPAQPCWRTMSFYQAEQKQCSSLYGNSYNCGCS